MEILLQIFGILITCFISALDADIPQISATDGKHDFNSYMVPTKPISAGASRVTQLTVRKGKLYHMGKPVDAVAMKDALQKFVNWLKAKNKKVLLFAHNAKAFDSDRIIYTLTRCNLLNPFRVCVAGFVDTLEIDSLFKNHIAATKAELSNFLQVLKTIGKIKNYLHEFCII